MLPIAAASQQLCHPCPEVEQCQFVQELLESKEWPKGLLLTSFGQKIGRNEPFWSLLNDLTLHST